MKLTENHRLLLKAAILYYHEGLTQAEIGKRLNFSRPVISKLLQQAKEQGIVEIFIKDENAHAVHLSVQLEKKFDLQEVLVVPSELNRETDYLKHRVGRIAAGYVVSKLGEINSIGLTWGTTLADVIDEMPYVSYPQINVVPMVGGVSSEHLYFDTNHLAFRLAEKLQGKCQYFYAPAMAESESLADALNHSEMVNKAVTAAKAVDLAIVGVGNPTSTSTWLQLGYLTKKEMQDITAAGIVGDVSASLFNQQGNSVDHEINQRLLGVTVEELAEMKQVMVVASGKEKIPSILGLLKGHRCHILVVDELIANELLLAD